MVNIGYSQLIDSLNLSVRPLTRPAQVSGSVNRRVDSVDHILFPRGVAIDDTVAGHLEFALRHEGVNLEVIDTLFTQWHAPQELIDRFHQAPNGTAIRRACHLWEWLTGDTLALDTMPTAGYADLFPPDIYVTATHAKNDRKFRVRNNALGTADFSPTVRRDALLTAPPLPELLERALTTLASVTDPVLYERALNYLYLSETRSSFAIEHEAPSSDKQERFVQLLHHAGQAKHVDEEWLVSLQNAVVRDHYSQEASYRTKQNWLEDATGRVTVFPVPQNELARSMRGWEAFINDDTRCTDVLIRAALSAFGFVYLHPFLDGNGRLHRFLIHHVLADSGLLPAGTLVPVSAVIEKNIPDYLDVLNHFSQPVTKLWTYVRGDPDPIVTKQPGSSAYRFFDASVEVAFLHRIIQQAIDEEIPRELAWLSGYDKAFAQLDAELDVPRKDLSALIRMVQSQHGHLTQRRRKQYAHLPEHILERIEQVVRESFTSDFEEVPLTEPGNQNI